MVLALRPESWENSATWLKMIPAEVIELPKACDSIETMSHFFDGLHRVSRSSLIDSGPGVRLNQMIQSRKRAENRHGSLRVCVRAAPQW